LDPSIREVRVSGSYTIADPDGILTTLAQTLPIRIARLTDRVAVLF
jgi:ferric-dicitrate binding protein FerR (iron transport regulator)